MPETEPNVAGEKVKVVFAGDKQSKTTAKFIQISSGLPYGQGLTLFALDAEGGVWQMVVDRDEEWKRLPKKRAGGPGRPASR